MVLPFIVGAVVVVLLRVVVVGGDVGGDGDGALLRALFVWLVAWFVLLALSPLSRSDARAQSSRSFRSYFRHDLTD